MLTVNQLLLKHALAYVKARCNLIPMASQVVLKRIAQPNYFAARLIPVANQVVLKREFMCWWLLVRFDTYGKSSSPQTDRAVLHNSPSIIVSKNQLICQGFLLLRPLPHGSYSISTGVNSGVNRRM